LLTGNRGHNMTGVAQNIDATTAKVLVKFQLHAGEAIGIGTWGSRLISAP